MDWKLLRKEDGPDIPLFKAEFHFYAHPLHSDVLKAIVLNARDTVNVIARTDNHEIALVQQFRFGIAKSLWELPAGLIDGDEEPIVAAKRELLEETGLQSDHWTYLGYSLINPAYVNNGCHHFLADRCIRVAEIRPDHFEQLEVGLYPEEKIMKMARSGEIRDAIGIAALCRQYPALFQQ